MKGTFTRILGLVLLSGMSVVAFAQALPIYKVDPFWPKELPNNWILGQVGGMAVDKDDHIWVFQRPRSLTADEAALAQKPPTCIFAPPFRNELGKGCSKDTFGDLVAQLVEHITFNDGALGASPSGITETPDFIRSFFI